MKPIPRILFDACVEKLLRQRDKSADPIGVEYRALVMAYSVRWGHAAGFVVDKKDAKNCALALRRVACLARCAKPDAAEAAAIDRVLELAKQLEGGAA